MSSSLVAFRYTCESLSFIVMNGRLFFLPNKSNGIEGSCEQAETYDEEKKQKEIFCAATGDVLSIKAGEIEMSAS